MLPTPLTTIIGRERELAELMRKLSATRLLTLTGAGGAGKTRLALELAASARDDVWWVALESLGDPGAVASAVAHGLALRPLPGVAELDAVVAFLRERRGLLVIDNCEHVVDEVARVVTALVGACPELSVLATSRVPLAIRGETRWTVPPLAAAAAARLFADRAGRIDPHWSCDDAAAIEEICRRLEGLPLALELAAGRVAALSPAAIAHGLAGALDLLAERSAVAEPRQRSMRASLDWSHSLLDAEQRRALEALGVFSGGASLEAALTVCRLPVLEALVEHSLLRLERDGVSVRYRLPEPVRQYALERLTRSGETSAARDRHRDVYLELAERAREDVLTPRQPEAFTALDKDAANLATAIDRALETDPSKALRLCLALDFWFRARARFRDADAAYARALAAGDPPPAARARALAAWAWIVGSSGEFERANALAAEAAALADLTQDSTAVAATSLVVANHRFFTDPQGALPDLHRCRDMQDEYIAARAEALLRGVAWFSQDERAGFAGFEALRARLERLGDRETLAWFWFEQGALRYPLGRHDEAARLFEQAIRVAGEVGEPTADRAARAHLALLDLAAGRAEAAREALLAIQDHTVLHGGSFALPWIVLLVAVAEAGCDRLDDARARLAALMDVEAWGAAHASGWAAAELAEVLRLLGDEREARQHGTAALERARRLRNPWLEAKAQLTLGRLAASSEPIHQALAAIDAHGHRLELPGALEALAGSAATNGRWAEAARALGAADAARRELGFVAWPAQRTELAWVRERVGDDLSAGPAPDAAVAWLRRGRGPRDRPARGWASLTPTEVEVARHAAAGLTNPQIAERLFVTRATVKTHLSHVYAKLDLRNRAQLARISATWPM